MALKIFITIIAFLAIIFFTIEVLANAFFDYKGAAVFHATMIVIVIIGYCLFMFRKSPEQKLQYHKQQIEKIEATMSEGQRVH